MKRFTSHFFFIGISSVLCLLNPSFTAAAPTKPELLRLQATRTCSAPCPVSLKGTWSYFITLEDSSTYSNGTFTLTQSGNRVNGTSSTAYRIFGNVESTGVRMTWVVEGEELEGYVAFSEGHYWNNRLMLFFQDSQGRRGSLTAFRGS